MGVFKDILSDEESLFINEVALSFDFMPKEVPYRESENQYIATCIKPLFQKRNGTNLFIHGSPGIGKTLAVRSVFKEMLDKGFDEEVIPIYINCWRKDTSHKIILDICEQLGYKFTHNRTTEELMNEVAKILNKKSVVIAFDEADQLSDHKILYYLLEDIYRKTIILVTNEKRWLDNLDERIKSRLLTEVLQFRPYNNNEVDGILKQRRDYAFVPNVFDKDAFSLIVDKTTELKDIRTGLFLLKEAGNAAESMSSRSIKIDHANSAIVKIGSVKIKSSADLDKEERGILQLIKDNSGKTVRELYELYKENGWNKAYNTFHRKVNELKNSKMIDVDEKSGKASSVVRYG